MMDDMCTYCIDVKIFALIKCKLYAQNMYINCSVGLYFQYTVIQIQMVFGFSQYFDLTGTIEQQYSIIHH